MEIAKTKYLGDLRTEIIHIRSGSIITTDAPVDNKGRGENFSPTDMVAAALGSCIFTIMGIAAREHSFSIDGSTCKITKIMTESPRKTCPVALSLNESVFQNVTMLFR
jgi:putative redox protein